MGERFGPIELVRGHEHRGALLHGPADEVIELVARLVVEAGVGFVQQPQLGPAGEKASERGTAPLPGRQAPDRDVPQPAVQADEGHGRGDVGGVGAARAAPEAHVVGHGQVVEQARGVAQQPDVAPDWAGVPSQIVAEDDRLAAHDRNEARAGAEHRGLAGAVWTAEQDDLAPGHVEVDTGQRGEASEERDGGTKVDDWLHDDSARLVTGRRGLQGDPRPADRPAFQALGVGLYPRTMRLARVLGAIGRVCITVGVLILLFVAYQLWGTGIREAQAQRKLENEFEQRLGDASVPAPDESAQGPPTSTTTAPGPPPPSVAEGDAVAHLRIPDIGVDKIVVEGVTLDDLKRGPGHYPDTPLPGQPGNAAIAGHRTTYGAPFNRIDELEPGDEILVTTVQGAFRYEVSDQLIVSPDEVGVLDDFGDNRVTLTACHPKYSARQRIIVVATLVDEPAPASEPPPGAETAAIPGDDESSGSNGDELTAGTIDGGLSGKRAAAWPAIALGVACGFIWTAAWLLGTLWRKWHAYLLCLPLFLMMLFFFFESFSRLLPANF
jgi:sortase A